MRWIAALVLCLAPVGVWADAAELSAKLDALEPTRDQPGVQKQIDALVSQGLKDFGTDYQLLWRAARARQWVADGAADERLKKQLGKEAWGLAERAILQKSTSVEGHYFAAAAIGAYSQAVGIFKALGEGLEGKFNERLDAAIRLNPAFQNGAPGLVKGRYFYELPWPKRDLQKSAELLSDTLAKHPANLRAYVYLAQTQLKDGDAKKASATLAKAETGSIDYDPPEGRRAQLMAKPVRAAIQKELP